MKKGKILTAIGTVIALIGILFLALAILPAEESTDFTIPSGSYYYAFSYGGLIGGSIEVSYIVADGSVRVYVFDQHEYDQYYATGSGDHLYTTAGDSGSFSFVLPDMGTYYLVFEHGALSGFLDQDVAITTTINGVAVFGTVLGVILIAGGIVLAIVGRRMKDKEIAQAPPSPAPTDVTFFQGEQQRPPGNV